MSVFVRIIASIFYQILYMSIVASIVGLVILLIQKIINKRISPKYKCYIWFVFIFILVFPISIPSKFSIYNFIDSRNIKIVENDYVSNRIEIVHNNDEYFKNIKRNNFSNIN